MPRPSATQFVCPSADLYAAGLNTTGDHSGAKFDLCTVYGQDTSPQT